MGNDSTLEKKMLEGKKDHKRKIGDLNETGMFPFAKTLTAWMECESTEAFKRRPQRPHFAPLLEEIPEVLRERFALGLMQSFLDLSEKVENLGKDLTISQLDVYKESFVCLEKYGFDASAPLSQIDDLLSQADKSSKEPALEHNNNNTRKKQSMKKL